MINNPKNLFLFTFTSIIAFSCLIYFSTDSPQRSISSTTENFTVDPIAAGQRCANEMEAIEVGGDWKNNASSQESIQEAFTVCLSEYIRIKTISPAGDEHKAVEFFEQIFQRLEYPYKKYEVEDLTKIGSVRHNIIATLSHDFSRVYDWSVKKDKRSVILLNHTDVVGTTASQWEDSSLAWSGAVTGSHDEPDRDFIWGRGALDMKGMAITQMISMHILKLKNIPLSRDIHFVANADEEQSSSGAIGTLKKMREGEELYALSNASLILNEGGGAIEKTPSDKFNLFLLAVEEKGGAWMDIEHSDPAKLLRGLNKAKIIDIKKFISRKEKIYTKHSCSIQKIETPGAKVNIVASKIILDFKCLNEDDHKDLFENVFTKSFKTITTDYKRDGTNNRLVIEARSASHGSLGVNESAMDSVAVGLHRLGLVKLKRRVRKPKYFRNTRTAATKMFVKTLSQSNFMLKIVKTFQFIPFIKNLVLSGVEDEFGVDGLFRTTCQFSALTYDKNKANALVDCRLLHTAKKHKHSHDHAGDFKKELISKIKDADLSIEIIDGWNVSQSSIKSNDYKLIVKGLKQSTKNNFKGIKRKTLVSPFLFPAGSDSTWFRNPWSAGVNDVDSVPSYGFFTAYLTPDILSTFHGANERFPVDQIKGTIIRYESVLDELTRAKKRNSK